MTCLAASTKHLSCTHVWMVIIVSVFLLLLHTYRAFYTFFFFFYCTLRYISVSALNTLTDACENRISIDKSKRFTLIWFNRRIHKHCKNFDRFKKKMYSTNHFLCLFLLLTFYNYYKISIQNSIITLFFKYVDFRTLRVIFLIISLDILRK